MSIGFSKVWKIDCKRERLEKSKPVTRLRYTPLTLLVWTVIWSCVFWFSAVSFPPQCLAALTIHLVGFHLLNEQLNEGVLE